MNPWRLTVGARLLAIAACASLAPGQGAAQQGKRPPKEKQDPETQDPTRTAPFGFMKTSDQGDDVEAVITGGLRYSRGDREVRAESVVIRMDRDEYKKLDSKGSGLPFRGTVLPATRRQLTGEELAHRLEFFLQSLGSPRPATAKDAEFARLVRSIYMEGNIVIVDSGVEVLTADSLAFSVPDNRLTLEGAVMRLVSKSRKGPDRVLVLRAPRLLKHGARITGRDVSLTTCTAGKPHFEVLSGEIEVIEHGDEFEVFSRGNNLAFSGRRTVPLPDAHFYTGEQSDIPVRGARFRYSGDEGLELGVDLGRSMNESGGALHELLTGRPAGEFRGEWRVGLGYVESRGEPIDGELEYRGGDLYEGRTKAFYMSGDRGPNRWFIRNSIDGSLIEDSERHVISSENRVHLGPNWRLDVTAFAASDPSVYPEFHIGTFQEAEVPETSLHLRHADENRLFTVTGRTNLATFSYGDDRALSPSFVDELPVATYDLFSQPLFAVGEVDVLLDSATSAGWLEHEFDPRFPTPMPATGTDKTFRFDQKVEIVAPFHLGPFAVRPHASGRLTYYDNTVNGKEAERWALDAGVSLTTRFARTFESHAGDGTIQRIRHSIYPSVSVGDLYSVDGRPARFYQFDEIDSLNENGVIRVGLLNRLQKSTMKRSATRYLNPFDAQRGYRPDEWDEAADAGGGAREFLFLDLAQNLFPVRDRDNGGHVLGLGEYELIWRPQPEWIPVENLSFLVEGEYDWSNHRTRTFNTVARFGRVLGCHWYAGYRTDHMVDGAAIYAVTTDLFGRWNLTGSGAYDLQTNSQLYYATTLVRRDHDWILTMAVTYDTITDDTSFRMDFEPLFGGLTRRRSNEFAGMTGRGSDALLNY